MKVRFYCDVWVGQDITKYPLFAQNIPNQKSDAPNCKRIAFDVEIPNAWLFGTDLQSPEHIKAVEVEE